MTSCKACLSAGPHATLVVREMMFGTREEFQYIQCNNCGTLQRNANIPDEGKYYPPIYWSYGGGMTTVTFRSKIGALRERQHLLDDTIFGRILNRCRPRKMDAQLNILRHLKLKQASRILDVGCGSGVLLKRLARAGLKNLTGADPFFAGADGAGSGITIFKSDLGGLEGQFDVIMFHHAFEHLADPEEALLEARRHLAPHGKCLIRIPTCSSAAWREYGTDWVQLDAPRHIVIFSREGFAKLAERTGFRITDTIDDSGSFQFWGSEMYRRDIPLRSEKPENLFSSFELSEFQARADEINSRGEGDQTAFFVAPT
jgi:SAM-dependent methyltransferase